MDALRNQHVIVVDWCCMCKKSGESVDHLLLHCEMTSAPWNAFFSPIGFVWVMLIVQQIFIMHTFVAFHWFSLL
jgi:hypothetical protein